MIPAPSLVATLGDAIHLVESMDGIDAELADAQNTVNRSREFTRSASAALEEEQQWLQSEKDLCSYLLRDCERRLRRQHLARVCIETALLPFYRTLDIWHILRRAFTRRTLERRIQALDDSVGRLPRLQARIDSMDLLVVGLARPNPPIPRRSVNPRLRRAYPHLQARKNGASDALAIA